MHDVTLGRRATAEAIGSGLLLATVVGSGIMAERLAGGNVAIALLANTIATGAGLIALILTFGPISGAHFNPAVTLAGAAQGGLPWRDVPAYVSAQVLGAFAGVAAAHVMFEKPVFAASLHVRSGPAQLVSEFVATFGLLAVIWGVSRKNAPFVPFAVGAYITAAYWFTASTSFANPAVTLARAATDSFAGIRPVDAPAFVVVQFAGAAAATLLFRWLLPQPIPVARRGSAELIEPAAKDRGTSMDRVLFACVHNAGRSQMAAAWFNALANPARAQAISAGTEPGHHVHPVVVDAMKEVGIDLEHVAPRKLTGDLAATSSILVTMGCGEACPVVPGLKRMDWPLEDPKGKPLERVREIRDDVKSRVLQLLRERGWA
jgi:glycerol uptake facilitator-like aquaporin/protein-tyrosine-phosphatase